MKPKLLCSECSGELHPGDKFCGSCGAKVEDDASSSNVSVGASSNSQPRARSTSQGSATSGKCGLCGHENPINAITCESCGAPLMSGAEMRKHAAQHPPSPKKGEPVPFTFLTSWRLTVTLAIVLIVTVVTLRLTRKEESPATAAESSAAPASGPGLSDLSLKELTALEKTVADKPDDAPAWLRLSNMLQDAKMYSKAVESYGSYLALKPDDADARVDLGVTYYEYAVADSTRRTEYLGLAQKNFEHALTQNPKHQLAMFNLGVVSLQNSDMQGATGWFTKCAAVDTSTDTGKRAEMMIHQHTFSQQ